MELVISSGSSFPVRRRQRIRRISRYGIPEVASPEARVEIALKLPQLKKMFSPQKKILKKFFGKKDTQEKLQEIVEDPRFHKAAKIIAKPNIPMEKKREFAEDYLERKPWYKKMSLGKALWASAWVTAILILSFVVFDLVFAGGSISGVAALSGLTWAQVAPWIAPVLGVTRIAGLFLPKISQPYTDSPMSDAQDVHTKMLNDVGEGLEF